MNKLTFFTGLGMIGIEVIGILAYLISQSVDFTLDLIVKFSGIGVLILFNIVGIILMIMAAIKE